ncbi:MAG: CoA-binding protein [Nitriliruptoraceae bacterium]|nr:CoA-binding protein [Nitriliruptoraceae bacterium]
MPPDEMPLDPRSPDELRAVLAEVRRIAIVGVSADPSRASHGVARWLIDHSDLDVALVNPNLDELFDRPVHDTLAELPDPVDLVDVFRRSEHLAGVIDESVAIDARVVWAQLGVRDEVAAARARAGGVAVVQDRCLKVDWAQLRPHG